MIYPDIKEYLTPEYQHKFEKNSFQSYLNANQVELSWCPTPGCEYVFVFDEGMKKFWCPNCKRKYCLKCKGPYHPDSTCASRIDDLKFLKFAKGAKYKECSKCKRWVEKKSGCNHITCICGHHFCYKCGGDYDKCSC